MCVAARVPSLLGRWFVVLLVCGSAGACGKSEAKLVPVSGTVTLDGKPAQGISVAFTPLADRAKKTGAGPSSVSITDAQGRFTLETAEKSRRSGAVPGRHSVMFTIATERAPDDDSIETKPAATLPAQYSDGSMTFEVPAAGTDKADFDLKGSPATAPAKGSAAASNPDL